MHILKKSTDRLKVFSKFRFIRGMIVDPFRIVLGSAEIGNIIKSSIKSLTEDVRDDVFIKEHDHAYQLLCYKTSTRVRVTSTRGLL